MKDLSTISAAQLQRAAALKKQIDRLQVKLSAILGNTVADTAVPKRKRRKMSAAARAKIAKAQRARWAKQKAAAKK